MSLTVEQQEQLINWFFSPAGPHPEVCLDDHNLRLIAAFLKEKTAGPHLMNRASLEWAVKSLAGQLHYYAGVDLSAQLAAGAEAQKRLAEEQAEKDRQAAALLRRQRLEQEQRNRTPGVASAFAGQDDVAAKRQREAANRQKEVLRQQEHAAFLSELANINVYLVTDSQGRIRHGATGDYKRAAKENLKRKYPAFASEIT